MYSIRERMVRKLVRVPPSQRWVMYGMLHRMAWLATFSWA